MRETKIVIDNCYRELDNLCLECLHSTNTDQEIENKLVLLFKDILGNDEDAANKYYKFLVLRFHPDKKSCFPSRDSITWFENKLGNGACFKALTQARQNITASSEKFENLAEDSIHKFEEYLTSDSLVVRFCSQQVINVIQAMLDCAHINSGKKCLLVAGSVIADLLAVCIIFPEVIITAGLIRYLLNDIGKRLVASSHNEIGEAIFTFCAQADLVCAGFFMHLLYLNIRVFNPTLLGADAVASVKSVYDRFFKANPDATFEQFDLEKLGNDFELVDVSKTEKNIAYLQELLDIIKQYQVITNQRWFSFYKPNQNQQLIFKKALEDIQLCQIALSDLDEEAQQKSIVELNEKLKMYVINPLLTSGQNNVQTALILNTLKELIENFHAKPAALLLTI